MSSVRRTFHMILHHPVTLLKFAVPPRKFLLGDATSISVSHYVHATILDEAAELDNGRATDGDMARYRRCNMIPNKAMLSPVSWTLVDGKDTERLTERVSSSVVSRLALQYQKSSVSSEGAQLHQTC